MQEINQFFLNVFEESNIFKEEKSMAKRGRPRKQSARRKNGEGGFRERIKKVAIKSKKEKDVKECFICRNCTLDRATICKNRTDCNSRELCKKCEEHKDCDKFRFYKYLLQQRNVAPHTGSVD